MRKFAFALALLFTSSFAYADPPIPPPTLLNNSGNGTIDISGGATVSTSVTSLGTETLTATNISLTASDGTSFVAIDRGHTRSNGTNSIEITFKSTDNSRYLTFDIPVIPSDPPTGYGTPPSLSGFIDYVKANSPPPFRLNGTKVVYGLYGDGQIARSQNFPLFAGVHLKNEEPDFTSNLIDLHVASVPEPETYSLVIVGLSILGMTKRARKAT